MSIINKIKGAFILFGAVLMTGIAYPLGRLFYRNKGIWLIGERPDEAQDNGYMFYRYVVEKHPERNAYYVIKRDSYQREKVAGIGKVINYGSWKHWLMYFGCEAVICAHICGVLPSTHWRYKALASKHKQKNKKIVFLQHGIISSNIPSLYKKKTNVDLFICGAKPEYYYVRNCFHYRDNEVKYTGLARYDALHEFTVKKQIVIMPTWRTWLVKKGYHIETSEYVKEWNRVISDRAMIEAAKKAGYQIIFYLHFMMQFARDLFPSVDENVVIADPKEYDVLTLLKESALLITDFSSVFFDFAYMRKPSLFFQFDRERHSGEHYQKSYFNYKKNGFGKVADTAPELVENVIEALDNGVVLSEKYNKRINRYFPLFDGKNCERIYKEIEKLVEK